MRLSSVTLLALVAALAAASPINTFRFDTDDFSNEQSLEVETNAVTGHYTFMTPEGIQFFVRYIADARGFRILDSNALPQRRPSAARVQQQQQRSRQASSGNFGGQQRSRQAFGSSSRHRFDSRESNSRHRFDSRESNELFDSDERRFF